jgi:hypothetical protein
MGGRIKIQLTMAAVAIAVLVLLADFKAFEAKRFFDSKLASDNSEKFEFSGGEKLLPSSLGSEARFGVSLSLSGDRLAVGAPDDDGLESQSGVVYIYRKFKTESGFQWSIEQTLLGPKNKGLQDFGTTLVLDKDRILIGDPSDQGAVYFYQHQEGSWQFVSEIVPSVDSSVESFGISMDFENEKVAIGGFRKPTRGLSSASDVHSPILFFYEIAKDQTPRTTGRLELPSEVTLDFRNRRVLSQKFFGQDLLVGLFSEDQSGEVFYFKNQSRGFELVQTLNSQRPVVADLFGYSMDVEQNQLVVGAPRAENSRGTVFSFIFKNGLWKLQDEISSQVESSYLASEFFGQCLDLDSNGKFLIVGGVARATVYKFDVDEWDQVKRFAKNPEESQFGFSCVTRTSESFVGEPFNQKENSPDRGAVYNLSHE